MPSEVNTAKSAEARKEDAETGSERSARPDPEARPAPEPEEAASGKSRKATEEPGKSDGAEPGKSDGAREAAEPPGDLETELEEAPTEPVELEEAPTERVDPEDAPTVPVDLEDAPTRRSATTAEEDRASAAPAPGPSARSAERVRGNLHRGRSGPVRVLFWITGIALLAWIGRGVVALLGYRHPATVSLSERALEIVGERRFMGLGLGETRRTVPLSSVQLVDLVARSGLWVLVAAVCALALAAAIGITLVLWGVSGGEPSWIVGGLLAIGLGVLLDALAYLWVRLSGRRGLADLSIQVRGARMRLAGVPHALARQLVDRIARHD